MKLISFQARQASDDLDTMTAARHEAETRNAKLVIDIQQLKQEVRLEFDRYMGFHGVYLFIEEFAIMICTCIDVTIPLILKLNFRKCHKS